MRGKQRRKHGAHTKGGITPAHAGKTNLAHAQSPAGWDHPRACGENTSERAYFRG